MLEIPGSKGLVALLSMLALVAGCGGGEAGSGASGGDQSAAAAVVEHPVDAATAGGISGTVTFAGEVPAPVAIDMADEPTCQEQSGGSRERDRGRGVRRRVGQRFRVCEGRTGSQPRVPCG